MSNPYHVEISKAKGFIRIARHSREMLYWEESEFEDPDTVFAIVEAVRLALTDPIEMDRKMRELKKLK